jgi:hypothetical protein
MTPTKFWCLPLNETSDTLALEVHVTAINDKEHECKCKKRMGKALHPIFPHKIKKRSYKYKNHPLNM